jgi:mannose-P-dolichol utilization defect protein 1
MLGGGSIGGTGGIAVPGVSMEVLTALQASTIFIVALGGRLPQIVLNAKRGDSGQLSGATSALNLAGNFARVFTTVVLTGDFLNLVGALVQAVLNGTLLAQCVATAKRGKKGGSGEGGGGGSPVPALAS